MCRPYKSPPKRRPETQNPTSEAICCHQTPANPTNSGLTSRVSRHGSFSEAQDRHTGSEGVSSLGIHFGFPDTSGTVLKSSETRELRINVAESNQRIDHYYLVRSFVEPKALSELSCRDSFGLFEVRCRQGVRCLGKCARTMVSNSALY